MKYDMQYCSAIVTLAVPAGSWLDGALGSWYVESHKLDGNVIGMKVVTD